MTYITGVKNNINPNENSIYAAWVNLRRGILDISIGNERNSLGKEHCSESIVYTLSCHINLF